jgi:hypothetical protein
MVRGADDVGDRGGEKKRIWGNDAAPSAGGCVGAGYRRLGCKALRSCAAALPAALAVLGVATTLAARSAGRPTLADPVRWAALGGGGVDPACRR